MRTGEKSAAKTSPPVSRSRHWTPSRDSKNAIDDQLQDTTSVLDAFHIVKFAGDAPGEVRRRVQQDTLGHRTRTGAPLYPGPQSLARLTHAGSPRANKNASVRPSRQMKRISVSTSPTLTGQVRDVFHQDTPAHGRRLAAHLIQRLPACLIPEIARLGRTLRKWKDAFLAYFDTGGASNGPTEAINGHYRTGQTNRQRLPQPHQLQTPNAPHRRRPRRLHTPNYEEPTNALNVRSSRRTVTATPPPPTTTPLPHTRGAAPSAPSHPSRARSPPPRARGRARALVRGPASSQPESVSRKPPAGNHQPESVSRNPPAGIRQAINTYVSRWPLRSNT